VNGEYGDGELLSLALMVSNGNLLYCKQISFRLLHMINLYQN
jgi:hypothetical protein